MHKENKPKRISRKQYPFVLMRDKLAVAFGPSRTSLVPMMQVLGGCIVKRTL